MTDIKTVATEADTVIKEAMKFEPFLATAAAFIPGAQPVIAVVAPAVAAAAPFVEKALEAIAAGNNGDALGSFIELLQHLTPGQPNSSILSAPAPALTQQGSGA